MKAEKTYLKNMIDVLQNELFNEWAKGDNVDLGKTALLNMEVYVLYKRYRELQTTEKIITDGIKEAKKKA